MVAQLPSASAAPPRSWPGAFLHVSLTSAIMTAIVWLVFGTLIHLFLFAVIDVSRSAV